MSSTAHRSIVIFTTAVLVLDGAALLALGIWGRRTLWASMGLVFLIAAALVLLSRRWYRHRLAEIAATHGALAEERREMQGFFGQK